MIHDRLQEPDITYTEYVRRLASCIGRTPVDFRDGVPFGLEVGSAGSCYWGSIDLIAYFIYKLINWQPDAENLEGVSVSGIGNEQVLICPVNGGVPVLFKPTLNDSNPASVPYHWQAFALAAVLPEEFLAYLQRERCPDFYLRVMDSGRRLVTQVSSYRYARVSSNRGGGHYAGETCNSPREYGKAVVFTVYQKPLVENAG